MKNSIDLRNSTASYGLVAIFFHWLDVIAIVGLFAIGFYMVDLTYYDSLYTTLPFWHKSVGMMMLFWFVARVAWRLANPKPEAAEGVKPIEHRLGHIAHLAIYLAIAIVLVSGYLIPTAAGAPISIFDVVSIPAVVTSIPNQEDIAGLVHRYVAYGLVALVTIHAAAALKHHFINRDNTLRRMLGLSDKT